MENLKKRMASDSGASVSVEQIGYLVLALFAVLFFYRFVLAPLRNTTEGAGNGMENWFTQLLNSDGKSNPKFEFTAGRD